MSEKTSKLKFHFHSADTYRLVPINGVWGGATPRGEIKADFFYESASLPTSVTHEVNGETFGREIERVGGEIVRLVEFGMILSPEQARSIGQWLVDKATEVTALRQKLDAMQKSQADTTDSIQ